MIIPVKPTGSPRTHKVLEHSFTLLVKKSQMQGPEVRGSETYFGYVAATREEGTLQMGVFHRQGEEEWNEESGGIKYGQH